MKSSSVIARSFFVFVPSILFLSCTKDENDNTPERQVVTRKSISSEGGRLALFNINEDSFIFKLPIDALSNKSAITMTVLDIPTNSTISNIVFTRVILEPSDLIFNVKNSSWFYLRIVDCL